MITVSYHVFHKTFSHSVFLVKFYFKLLYLLFLTGHKYTYKSVTVS